MKRHTASTAEGMEGHRQFKTGFELGSNVHCIRADLVILAPCNRQLRHVSATESETQLIKWQQPNAKQAAHEL